MLIPIKFFLFYCINTTGLITSGIQIIQILYITSFCKCNSQRIHCMMTMIITFCPVLYTTNFATILIFDYLSKSQFIIFFPIKLLHYVYQLPILTQTIRDSSGSGNNKLHQFFQYLPSFLRYIL